MTLTVTIQKLGTTAIADVDILGLDQTKLKLVASDKRANGGGGGSTASEYTLADGSLEFDTSVLVTLSYDGKANGGFGLTRVSWRLASELTIDDSVLGRVGTYPVAAGLYLEWPGNGISDVTEARQIINNIFALTFPSVAAGVINDTFLTNLAYGITGLY